MSSKAGKTVYAFSASVLDGETLHLEVFRGRVLLIVNTASKCGFTPQYAGLESLYDSYRDRGLEVLGFPCNQFGGQEPGGAEQIGAFCRQEYGVEFPIFAKVEVNGRNAHPLYQFLKRERPGLFGVGRVAWNFTKFLVDRQGAVVRRFGPKMNPEKLAGPIEELLAK